MNRQRKTYIRLMQYMLRYKMIYALLLFTMFLGVALDLSVAWYLNQITNAAVLAESTIWSRLILTGAVIVLFTIINAYMNIQLKVKVSSSIRNDLRKDTLHHILRLPEQRFNQQHSGDLLSRMTNDNQAIGDTCGEIFISLLRSPLLAVSAFVYLLMINWPLALICICIAPLTMIVGTVFGKAIRRNTNDLQKGSAKQTSLLQEILSSSIVFKTFGLEKKLHRQFAGMSDDVACLENKTGKLQAALSASANGIGITSFMVAFILGAYFVAVGEMQIGALVAFIQLMNFVTGPFMQLANLWGGLQKGLGAADRIFQIMDEKTEYASFPEKSSKKDQFRHIKLEEISAGYGVNDIILQKINLFIEPGKKIAVVGPSGGGKTTLLKLILGLYRQSKGKMYIDDKDTDAIGVMEQRRYFSLVPQETYLFSGTIRDNILQGNENATEDEIVMAAKHANAYEFIIELEHGFDTEIGEHGARLSGGQKQRISIARALLRDAPVLLLDEATAALDNESERLVQEALQKLMASRTTFVVAHRLSTIRNADNILVMDQGAIIETGNHDQLMSLGGLYQKLYLAQQKGDMVPG